MERRDGIKKKLLYAVNAILPLLLGFIVYVCDRPNSYISILVYSLTGFRSSIRFFPTIIDNHFPDFVWAYSLMFVVNIFCHISFVRSNSRTYPVIPTQHVYF